LSKNNYAEITEDSFKYLKLGNSFTDHFVLEIIPKQKKGRMMLLDRNDLLNRYSVLAQTLSTNMNLEMVALYLPLKLIELPSLIGSTQ
jgi:hypothetical protein